MQNRNEILGYSFALGSAVFVGLFTVLNKWLLGEAVPPLVAGSWTYFAAGVALLPWALRARGLRFNRPWIFLGWLCAGSLIGPSLYFVGLKLTSGVEGVLMINMEAVFTALIAFLFFKEPLTRSTAIGGIVVLLGGFVISLPERGATSILPDSTLGNILIAVGYLGWATENNLGRLLGENIPAVSLVCVKALVASLAMGLLAFAFGQNLLVPSRVIPGIIASGAFALGLSLALFYAAMRHIGAGRTGLISSTSSLWGVFAALILLGESLSTKIIGGGLLMLIGLSVLAAEASGATPTYSRFCDKK